MATVARRSGPTANAAYLNLFVPARIVAGIAKIRTITGQVIIVEWGFTIGVDLAGPWT